MLKHSLRTERGARRAAVWGTAIAILASACVTPAPSSAPASSYVPTAVTTPVVSAAPSRAVARTCDMGVGPREVVVPRAKLVALGFKSWPDGIFGVLKDGPQYTFYSAQASTNGSTISRTVGTLDDPIAFEARTSVPIRDLKAKLDYLGGGPVYRDRQSGMVLMFYHAERWPSGKSDQFWASYGIAKSVDGGLSWLDLGEFYTPEVPFTNDIPPGTTSSRSVPVPAAAYAIIDGYFYVYAKDRSSYDKPMTWLTVARAPVADVVKAALERDALVPWKKRYEGAWNEPGLAGRASGLEQGNPNTRNSDVTWNEYLGKYVMVVIGSLSQDRDGVYLIESDDGVRWGPRLLINDEPKLKLFPTIVGTGDDPRVTGAEFYLYYPADRQNQSDTDILRRLISCDARTRDRPTLTTALADTGAGRSKISGRLISASGAPVAGTPVRAVLVVKDGPGVVRRTTLSGKVPAGATRAIANLNFLRQDGGRGAVDVAVYHVAYDEAGQQRVANGDFASGLQGWSGSGGTAEVVASDRGGGRMLRLRATEADTGLRTSTSFPVTPGDSFTATFEARVSASSSAAGFFAINFQDAAGVPVTRETALWDGVAADETLITGAEGTYEFSLEGARPTHYLLHASSPGDARRWYASKAEER